MSIEINPSTPTNCGFTAKQIVVNSNTTRSGYFGLVENSELNSGAFTQGSCNKGVNLNEAKDYSYEFDDLHFDSQIGFLSTNTTSYNSSISINLPFPKSDFATSRSDFHSFTAVEICNNGLDDDGDGLIDCEDCVDCASAIECGDNDGDGIGNYCDLDDDNDGIPDLDECPTITYGPELIRNGGFENGYAHWTSDFNRGRNNNSATKDGCTRQGWVAVSGCSSYNGSCAAYYNYYGSTPTGSTLITDAFGTGANVVATLNCDNSTDGCYATISPDHTSGTGLSLYIDPSDIAGKTYWQQVVTISPYTNYKFSAWFMVVEEDPNLVFKIGNNSIGPKFNLDLLKSQGRRVDAWQQFSVEWNSGSSSGSIVLELVNQTGGCVGNDIRVDDISLRSRNINCDADNDGINNLLDLDSDNDGILDVFEAGHAARDSNKDGIIDGPSNKFGANGLFNALETSTDNGVLNYSISDSEPASDGIYDAYEIDSDNDGCFDTIEESIADSERNGIAGTGTPTVTTEGLITSLTYTVPTGNHWQNPAVAYCGTENCANGIDDDGDGLIDCYDDECPQVLPVTRVTN